MNQEIDKHKKIVLLTLLKITFVAGCVFSFINYQRGLITFATIELIVTSIALWMYLKVRNILNQKIIEKFSLAYTLIFFSTMMLAFSTKGISTTMFIWAFTIPMMSYLLLGLRNGFIVTAFFYILSTILLFQNYNLQAIENITYANIFVAAFGFWGLSHTYEQANFLTKQKLNKMAIYDKLTGLHNRAILNQIFTKTVSKALEERLQISFLAFDLDLFKKVNDQFGHVTGDNILIKFSKMIKDNLPNNASAFRLGGEEFAVIFPCNSPDKAKDYAESMRLKTENITVLYDEKTVNITVSAGVAIQNPENASLTNMLKVSDKRLYQAKSRGRNRVVYQ